MGGFFVAFEQDAHEVVSFKEVSEALRPGLSPNLVLKHADTD